MTREQLTAFLAAGASHEPCWYPLWLGLARTGLRLGDPDGEQGRRRPPR